MIAPRQDRPVVDEEGFDRLALCDQAEGQCIDWNAVHERVQLSLDSLAEHVLRLRPGTPSRSGAVHARAFALFTYRVFDPPEGSPADSVIVGLTFGATGTNLRIRGDISREESGQILFDENCERVLTDPRQQDVMDIAGELADRLSAQVGVVVEALRPEL